jgi:cytidine deaminase
MRAEALTAVDVRLIDAAHQVIADNFDPGRHHLGAAVRMGDGRVFTGIHVEAHVGRITLCAEAVAIGTALSAGSRDIQAIVAVAHPRAGESDRDAPVRSPLVVAPCGMCRELISDFGPGAWVVIPGDDDAPVRVPVHELLPVKYARRRYLT